MKIVFKTSKILNIIALLFLLGGPYGLIFTGFFQVIAALLFFISFPGSKYIYFYFLMVIAYFLIWRGNIFGWQLTVPVVLIFFLTYIIHYSKKK